MTGLAHLLSSTGTQTLLSILGGQRGKCHAIEINCLVRRNYQLNFITYTGIAKNLAELKAQETPVLPLHFKTDAFEITVVFFVVVVVEVCNIII